MTLSIISDVKPFICIFIYIYKTVGGDYRELVLTGFLKMSNIYYCDCMRSTQHYSRRTHGLFLPLVAPRVPLTEESNIQI